MARAKRKNKGNYYFTKEHENAIIEYVKTNDRYAKGKLYEKWIQPAFNEMVDKICFTYKFTSLPNVEYLRDDCKLWLITILEKYDPNKGHKAFSYFSVVTKNWFIQQAKKNSKRASREIDINDVHGELTEQKLTSSIRLKKGNKWNFGSIFWPILIVGSLPNKSRTIYQTICGSSTQLKQYLKIRMI